MKLTHLLKALCIALVLAFGGSLANGAPTPSPTPSRDWVSHPAVVQGDNIVDKNNVWTLFAIGDVHADPERLIGVLKAAGIISPETPINVEPNDVKWTFHHEQKDARSVLVMTGDMIDKGPRPGGSSLRVIAILRALQTSAVASNGQVIILMGNHEAEFLADPNGSKTADFASELRTANIDPATVANCQGDLGQFLCNLPIAAKVDDWFFSHAGNTNGRTIAALSADIEAGFASKGFKTPELTGDPNSILEARLNSKGCNHLPWFYECHRETDPQKVLKRNATALGVNHIVQGHQPGSVAFLDGVTREEDAVFQRYGLLFLIDTGMSRGVDGSSSAGGALRITFGNEVNVDGPVIDNTEAIVMCANGQEKRLWKKSVRNPDSVAQVCGINKP